MRATACLVATASSLLGARASAQRVRDPARLSIVRQYDPQSPITPESPLHLLPIATSIDEGAQPVREMELAPWIDVWQPGIHAEYALDGSVRSVVTMLPAVIIVIAPSSAPAAVAR